MGPPRDLKKSRGPATSGSKANETPHPGVKATRKMKQNNSQLRKSSRISSRQMAKFKSTVKSAEPIIIDSSSESEEISIIGPSANSHDSIANSNSDEIMRAEEIPKNFEDFLNSLEEILVQPPTGVPSSPFTKDMAEARKKLSEILATDIHVLLSSKDLITEAVALSSKLQKGFGFHGPEYDILKLIEEIPSRINDLEEAKKAQKDADKFFSDVEANIAQATNLKHKFTESRTKKVLLQTNITSESLALKKINEKISNLRAQRYHASSVIEEIEKEMAEISSKQRMVFDCLPKVVQEIQLARAQTSEWELKKKTAEDHRARILEKFAPLKGFSFERL